MENQPYQPGEGFKDMKRDENGLAYDVHELRELAHEAIEALHDLIANPLKILQIRDREVALKDLELAHDLVCEGRIREPGKNIPVKGGQTEWLIQRALNNVLPNDPLLS